ncbi:MAG: hypothetical protein OEL55_05990, partial [Desulfobulbaceae bacterium]|nr:hypothetical protein [Desulfobulbaceae bacterium]
MHSYAEASNHGFPDTMNTILAKLFFFCRNAAATNTFSRTYRWGLVMLSLGAFFAAEPVGQAIANSLSARATFAHSMEGGQDKTEQQTLSQRYSTGFSSKPTEAITISGALGYNKGWQEHSGSNSSRQSSTGLKITNDIFTARINGAAGFQMPNKKDDSKSIGWNSSLTSNISKKFWPSLRVNFGQTTNTNDAEPQTSDSKSKRAGLATGIDLILGQVAYRYNTSTSTNNLTGTGTNKKRQTASFSTGHSFWNNRISIGFSQGYSQSTTSTTRYIQPTGMVDLPIRVTVATSAIDNTPLFDPLPPTPALADEDLATTALTINNGDIINIGFSSDEPTANRIYLYINPSIIIDAADAANLRFSLYKSSIDDGNTWTQVATTLTPTFDDENHRYILDYNFDFNTTIFKLVATNWPTAAVPLTELQIISRQPGASIPLEDTQKRSNSSSNFNTTILLSKNVPLNYSFSITSSKNPAGVKSTTRTQAGNLNLHWNLNKYCQPSINMNTSSSKSNANATRSNRSIGLSINSSPLPTVHANLGTTHNENLLNDVKIGTVDRYNFSLGATLYPDLTTALSFNRSESRSTQNDASSNTMSSSFGLTARLSSKLTTSFVTNYNRSSTASASGESTGKTSKGVSLAMNIRPSDILSLRLNASQQWEADSSPPIVTRLGV